MTDVEPVEGRLPDVQLSGETLLSSTDAEFAELTGTLSVEDLQVAGLFLTQVSKVSSLRVGQVAYQIRTQTPDGQWGREVYSLAEQWEVSERTIHRWMASAQQHFGLELTAAQKNAQASSTPDESSEEDAGTLPTWDDDGSELSDMGFDLDGDPDPDLVGVDGASRLHDLIGEPWAERDSVTPSPAYENKHFEGATPAELLVEPDDTWVAFTAHSIQVEHDGYSDVAAERMAKARWSRKLGEDPLDLLEELEMIYEAAGETLSDEIITKLHQADDQRVLVPDEVSEGGKKPKAKRAARGKFAYDQAEKLLTSTRQLYEMCFKGLKEGNVSDKEVAAMLPHLTPIPYTIKGLLKMAEEAKERVLAQMSPEEKIAMTLAAEAAAAAEEEDDEDDDDDETPGF